VIALVGRPYLVAAVAFVTLCYVVMGICAAAQQSVPGRISGTVTEVMGDHTNPATGVRVSAWTSSDERVEYEAVTDQTGQYTIDLPAATYGLRLHWFGECSTIRRAAFNLASGEHLTFDFLVVPCPVIDTLKKVAIPFEEAGAKGSVTSPTTETSVSLGKQTEKYQEQLIPSERNRWPEIMISFGKSDDRGAEKEYFPLQSMKVTNRTLSPTIVPMSLPVTVTVDRYTLRASDVVWDKKTMVFKAKGEVSLSDGRNNSTGTSVTLSFPAGLPMLGTGKQDTVDLKNGNLRVQIPVVDGPSALFSGSTIYFRFP
jgi:hypothetical protein